MLHKHFGLKKNPFISNSTIFFKSKILDTSFIKLQTTLCTPQIALITGKIGSGKTSIIKAFVNTLDPMDTKVIMTPIANPSPRSIFKNISSHAGLPKLMYGDDIKLQLINYFDEIRTEGKSVLVILDECHTFSIPVLDQLKTFFDTKSNFSLILVGLPTITKSLRQHVLLPFKQRISIFINTTTLSLEETKNYIEFRLKEAGSTAPIFGEAVFPLIHLYSEGVYRMIDQLCFQALTIAYMNKNSIISTDIVESAYNKLDYDF